MGLHHLEIRQFRNLSQVTIQPNQHFNVIFGQNGSGKSSLLEAIHYISLGRSFRTHLHNRVICYEQDSFFIFGQYEQAHGLTALGLERHRNGDMRLRIGGENAASPIELAKIFPLQLINSDSHRELLSAPKFRRQFIDWGVFHVEQTFMPIWQRTFRALKQRNAAIKSRGPINQVRLWDNEFVTAATQLHILREQYCAAFNQVYQHLFAQLLNEHPITLSYQAGWPIEEPLETVLAEAFSRDLDLGYTQFGPQRADLGLRANGLPVQDVLSQGQLKLVVYAMRLAQGLLMQQQTGKQCTFLIDDLPAELDREKRERVIKVLNEIGSQVFITGIERSDMVGISPLQEANWFHVERGEVSVYS